MDLEDGVAAGAWRLGRENGVKRGFGTPSALNFADGVTATSDETCVVVFAGRGR